MIDICEYCKGAGRIGVFSTTSGKIIGKSEICKKCGGKGRILRKRTIQKTK